MQRVIVKPDDLDQLNRNFGQQPLRRPVFLNSLPKSGSHLLRNIIRMFVPVPQQYKREFIQHPILHEHLEAFDKRSSLLSWGHLPFSDQAALALSDARKLILVRDPRSWVVSCARFLQSDQFVGLDHLKTDAISTEELFNIVIFGIWQKLPGLAEQYTHTAIAWIGTDAYLVRYEELVGAVRDLQSEQAERYFTQLLAACGIECPDDWQERIRIGADPEQSGTAQQNLTLQRKIPKELPETQNRMIDLVAPGLRDFLGYS